MEAADYALRRIEERVDEIVGTPVREALGRYCAVVVIGVPIAWAVPGFHWERTSTFGLAAGLVLFAVLDVVRLVRRDRRTTPPQ